MYIFLHMRPGTKHLIFIIVHKMLFVQVLGRRIIDRTSIGQASYECSYIEELVNTNNVLHNALVKLKSIMNVLVC